MAYELSSSVKYVNPILGFYTEGPWTSVSDANTNIAPAIRVQGMACKIIIAGVAHIYWYRDGILDTDLVEFTSGVSGVPSTESIVAGESLVAGNLVYLKSDGKWWKTDYLTEATVKTELRIVSASTIAADASGLAYKPNTEITLSGLTVGVPYYIGATGGLVTSLPETEGILQRYVGTAKSSTVFEFNPNADYYELTLLPPSSGSSSLKLFDIFYGAEKTLPTTLTYQLVDKVFIGEYTPGVKTASIRIWGVSPSITPTYSLKFIGSNGDETVYTELLETADLNNIGSDLVSTFSITIPSGIVFINIEVKNSVLLYIKQLIIQ